MQRNVALLLLLALLICISCQSSKNGLITPPEDLADITFYRSTELDQKAQPQNGIASIYKKINYPLTAQLNLFEGKSTLELIVMKDQSVLIKKVTNHSHAFLDHQSLKAIKTTPFKPAYKDGKPVNSLREITITFDLPEENIQKIKTDIIPKTYFGDPDKIFYAHQVDSLPKPVNGYRNLARKVNYPKIMRKQGVSGEVWVSFLVNPNGSTGPLKVVKSVHEKLDQEAIRVLNDTQFLPAIKEGEAVPTIYTTNVNFRLSS